MFVFKAGVVGAGVMGGEIAQVIAAAGLPVVLKDVDTGAVEAGMKAARAVTERQVAKLVERGKLPEAAAADAIEAIVARVEPTTSYAALGDADFVIEAVPEKMAIKHAVFAELDAATPGHAVLASNTSGLSISEIAEVVERPERVVGFHFFWPASRMRLVEVIEGAQTSAETLQVATSLVGRLRKVGVRCADAPGFVVNRILTSTASEVWRHQEETGESVEAIDEALVAAQVAPMGPFRLADMSGLDTTVKVARDLRDALGDSFHVHAAMEELVARGDLGAKTGKGFYEHR